MQNNLCGDLSLQFIMQNIFFVLGRLVLMQEQLTDTVTITNVNKT